MRCWVTCIVSCLMILGPGNTALAWGPVAHYFITLDAGYPELAPYANVPDYRSSHTLNVISEYFCWSHAIQDAGYSWGVPKVYSYPDDGRLPGFDMVVLTKKLKQSTQEMTRTAEGTVAHNAGDRVVHCDFFLGGTHAKWVTHHGNKELWADYLVYFTKYKLSFKQGAPNSGFDQQGRLAPPPGAISEVPYRGSATLMHLAQKVYRKNSRKTDADASGKINVQSVGTIQGLLDAMPYDDDFALVNWSSQRWQELYQQYLQFQQLAQDRDPSNDWQVWSIADLWTYYADSKVKVQNWVGEARSMQR